VIKRAKDALFLWYNGEELDLYQEQFNELYQLVKSYTALLGADLALMTTTGKEMYRTDSVLGQNMFPGLQ